MSSSSGSFDVIVIGVGSMGSAACYFMADRGYKVLGLEQFSVVHERGSHTGQSRIIRKAYFEHPDYVPLLERAYENWKLLEHHTGASIYHRTGILYFGQPSNPTMEGIRDAAKVYGIPVEKISAEESRSRFPQFRPSADFEILFEDDAGFVTPERAIQCYTSEARKCGASILENTKVTSWDFRDKKITVKTNAGVYVADKLVITSGSWTSKIVPTLREKLTVTKQMLVWITPERRSDFSVGNFPCWFVEDPDLGLFYGFPFLEENKFGGRSGMKLAHHHPGEDWDPDNNSKSVSPKTEENIRFVLNRYLPSAGLNISAISQCLYTYSPDTNFIIDHLPGTDERVSIACGFSGHGFKFVSVVGEILADLALKGSTKLPIEFLRLNRFVAK